MTKRRKSVFEFESHQLDRQLIATGARHSPEELFQFPHNGESPERDRIMAKVKDFYKHAAQSQLENQELNHLDACELVEALRARTGGEAVGGDRGRWGEDGRMDYYKIDNDQVRQNADAVAAICYKRCLMDTGNNRWKLDVRNYRHEFSLSHEEPFHQQPISAGRLCTGFLVAPDIIATAAHAVDNGKLANLCFIFGFKMTDACTVNLEVRKSDIYTGMEIIGSNYDRAGKSDWALVKLDRKVEGHPVVTLSNEASMYESVYVLGHPVGLPLKYSSGAEICATTNASFSANLDIYQGNSGSPVFSSETHKVIGIVVHGDGSDFRWTEDGWLSVVYPNPDYRSVEPQCTRVSEFKRQLI